MLKKKKLLSLALAAAILLGSNLVGMVTATKTITLSATTSHFNSKDYPLHEIATAASLDLNSVKINGVNNFIVEKNVNREPEGVKQLVNNLLHLEQDKFGINFLNKSKLTALDFAEETGNNALAGFLKDNGGKNAVIRLSAKRESYNVKYWLAKKYFDYFKAALSFNEGNSETISNASNDDAGVLVGVFNYDFENSSPILSIVNFTLLFEFIEQLKNDVQKALIHLLELDEEKCKKLCETLAYFLFKKEAIGSLINKLDYKYNTHLDIAIKRNNQSLINLLKELGGKETHHVPRTCSSIQEVLKHLENQVDKIKAKLIVIDLRGKNIGSISEEEATDLASYNIGCLDLSSNQLTALPANFGQGMGNLNHLNLSSNQLTALLANFGQGMGNLNHLNLFFNQLTAFPANSGQNMGNLDFLNLSSNQLTVLPANFGQGMGKLDFLNLSFNLLTALPANFGQNMGNLNFLGLSSNQLTALPANFGQNMDKLNHLDLSRNTNLKPVSREIINQLRECVVSIKW